MASGYREGKGFAAPAALTACRKAQSLTDPFRTCEQTLAKPAVCS